jgi:hypothetical protein
MKLVMFLRWASECATRCQSAEERVGYCEC